jgi:hypothetical protein
MTEQHGPAASPFKHGACGVLSFSPQALHGTTRIPVGFVIWRHLTYEGMNMTDAELALAWSRGSHAAFAKQMVEVK